jgi:AraC-like DNA-binding protein
MVLQPQIYILLRERQRKFTHASPGARLAIPRSTVQNVAESVGFKNRFVFSRAFERRFGLSPNVYRQSFQSSAKPV